VPQSEKNYTQVQILGVTLNNSWNQQTRYAHKVIKKNCPKMGSLTQYQYSVCHTRQGPRQILTHLGSRLHLTHLGITLPLTYQSNTSARSYTPGRARRQPTLWDHVIGVTRKCHGCCDSVQLFILTDPSVKWMAETCLLSVWIEHENVY